MKNIVRFGFLLYRAFSTSFRSCAASSLTRYIAGWRPLFADAQSLLGESLKRLGSAQAQVRAIEFRADAAAPRDSWLRGPRPSACLLPGSTDCPGSSCRFPLCRDRRAGRIRSCRCPAIL